MEPIGCTETSTRKYCYSLCNSSEERSSDWLVVCLGVRRRVAKRWSTASVATSGVCPLRSCSAVWSVWGEPSSDHAVPIAAEYSGRQLRQQYGRCCTRSELVSNRSATIHIVHNLYWSVCMILKYKGNVCPSKSLKIQGIFRFVIEEISADVSEDHSASIFRPEQPFLVCFTEKCEGTLTFSKRHSLSSQKTASPTSQLRRAVIRKPGDLTRHGFSSYIVAQQPPVFGCLAVERRQIG